MAAPPTPAHANTVGWYILEGYPWWPVYICDQFKLRAHLYQLGDGHKKILKKAKDFHRDYALVYYFGSHDFSLVKLNKGILKPWECSEKDQYLKGHPKHLMKKGSIADELSVAIQEVEDYLSQPEDMRLPPHMVPSDLDPTLEPPPPMERPEEAEDEDGDDDGDVDHEDGDDDEDAEMDGDEDDEADDGGEKKAKKTAKKEPKKKASAKKDKAEKDKKPKKDKKDKEKKPSKEKKDKKTPTKEKKEPATKKKSDDKPAKEKAVKRQRSSGDDGDADAKPKQAKKDKAADVKSEASAGGSENIEEILEREIRWILSNEQYEEMTTKTLRKVLEERLKRDLKQHRDTIKAVVTRVIEEEEDAVDATATAADGESSTKDAEKSDADGDVKMEESEPVKKEEPTPEPAEASNGASEPTKSDPQPEEDPVKVEKEDKVEEQEQEAQEQQLEEAPPPPPKPVDEAEILSIKDKLENKDTPHEELLAGISELQQMPLEFKHLKRTGIPRVVANLRHHVNDKVSIAAKDLRTAWLQLVEKEKQPTNLRELEKFRDTLEAEGESDATKLSVLQELDKLSVSTQEIIDAKIGVTISKLRKASHADLAQAANKLRQKWKKQAESQ